MKGFLHKICGTTPTSDLQPKEVLSYSIAGLGQNLICGLVGSYLMYYYTNGLLLSTTFVAWLMLGARLFDALNDPIMGSIVDKTKTKWGKCRPYLKWMPIPIAVLTIILFTNVLGSKGIDIATDANGLIYNKSVVMALICSVTYVAWSVLYTIVDVPYWGLATQMTNDTEKRGIMLTIARLCCTLGAGIISILVPIFADSIRTKYIHPEGTIDEITGAIIGGQFISREAALECAEKLQSAFIWIAIVIVILATPTFFIGFKNTKERYYDPNARANSLKHNLGLLFKNKPLLLIVLSGILGGAKIIFTYTGIYFATYNIPIIMEGKTFLGMSGVGLNTLITMSIVPGGLIASLLVPYFTKKVGKRNTYIWSHIIGGLILLIVYFIGWDTPAKLLINLFALVIVGIPSGFANIITYAMIGDTVDYLEYKTGERAEGICFAMQTFINKIGMAIGAFASVIALSIGGISAADPVSFSKANMKGLNVIYTVSILICAISNIATAIPLFFYKFTEKEQARVVAEIEERNRAAKADAIEEAIVAE